MHSMHAWHACMTCMHDMHARHVCTRHACMICMTCMDGIHDMDVMRAWHACMTCLPACLHTCMHAHHFFPGFKLVFWSSRSNLVVQRSPYTNRKLSPRSIESEGGQSLTFDIKWRNDDFRWMVDRFVGWNKNTYSSRNRSGMGFLSARSVWMDQLHRNWTWNRFLTENLRKTRKNQLQTWCNWQGLRLSAGYTRQARRACRQQRTVL